MVVDTSLGIRVYRVTETGRHDNKVAETKELSISIFLSWEIRSLLFSASPHTSPLLSSLLLSVQSGKELEEEK